MNKESTLVGATGSPPSGVEWPKGGGREVVSVSINGDLGDAGWTETRGSEGTTVCGAEGTASATSTSKGCDDENLKRRCAAAAGSQNNSPHTVHRCVAGCGGSVHTHSVLLATGIAAAPDWEEAAVGSLASLGSTLIVPTSAESAA